LGSVGLLAVASVAMAEPLATVGGRTFDRAEVEKHIKPKLVELENQRFEALKEGIDELVADELFKQEAKARSITLEALVKAEITDKIPTPSDADIKKVYDENKEALQNAPLEAVKSQIVDFLRGQQAQGRQLAFVNELKAKFPTKISLKAPVVQVGTGGRPVLGPENAPITIIEFSDYECPFCKRGEESVRKVLDAYKDKVKLIYRHYPLPFHKNAKPASVAALCAGAQGKFWEFHRKIWDLPSLSSEGFKKIATELSLDATKFDECVKKDEMAKEVDKDTADGAAVGVSGTPAFFINGRMLSGAQPFEEFKKIIDEELASAGSKS
jgi:protein-disulfide isomerase